MKKMTGSNNPLDDFILQKSDICFLGHDLNKPTCILPTPDGFLWATDSRGGVTKLSIDSGSQEFIGTETFEKDQPNSFIFIDKKTLMLANLEKSCIEILDLTNGKRSVLIDTVDGKTIGKVNFLLQDSKQRIWLSVSTRHDNIMSAFNPDRSDGYIALIEKNKIKIMAEGFSFTNEMRFDADEQYLYVSETGKKRINRIRVTSSGELKDREIVGPSDLGPANFPDGITFDSYGNLWCTIIGAEKIVAITPEGDLKILFDDGDAAAIKKIEEAYQNRAITREILFSGISTLVPLMTSITFAGPRFETVYIGSYGSKIPYFKSPVSGLKPGWWAKNYA